MKKKYFEPSIAVEMFMSENVITTSGTGNTPETPNSLADIMRGDDKVTSVATVDKGTLLSIFN